MLLAKLTNPDFSKAETYAMYLVTGLGLGLILSLVFYAAPAVCALMGALGATGAVAYGLIIGISMLSTLGIGLVGSALRDLKNMRDYQRLGPSRPENAYLDFSTRPYAAIGVAYLKLMVGIVLATPLVAMLMPKVLITNMIVPLFTVTSKWLLLPIAMLTPVVIGGPLMLLSMLLLMAAKRLHHHWPVASTMLAIGSNVFLIGALLSTLIVAWNPALFSHIATYFLSQVGLPAAPLDSLPVLQQTFASMGIAMAGICVTYFSYAFLAGRLNREARGKKEAEEALAAVLEQAVGAAERKRNEVPQVDQPAVVGPVNEGDGDREVGFGVKAIGDGSSMNLGETHF